MNRTLFAATLHGTLPTMNSHKVRIRALCLPEYSSAGHRLRSGRVYTLTSEMLWYGTTNDSSSRLFSY
jgi:hypothetical protein